MSGKQLLAGYLILISSLSLFVNHAEARSATQFHAGAAVFKFPDGFNFGVQAQIVQLFVVKEGLNESENDDMAFSNSRKVLYLVLGLSALQTFVAAKSTLVYPELGLAVIPTPRFYLQMTGGFGAGVSYLTSPINGSILTVYPILRVGVDGFYRLKVGKGEYRKMDEGETILPKGWAIRVGFGFLTTRFATGIQAGPFGVMYSF